MKLQSPKVENAQTELITFARFHAREREEGAIAGELGQRAIRLLELANWNDVLPQP